MMCCDVQPGLCGAKRCRGSEGDAKRFIRSATVYESCEKSYTWMNDELVFLCSERDENGRRNLRTQWRFFFFLHSRDVRQSISFCAYNKKGTAGRVNSSDQITNLSTFKTRNGRMGECY